MLTVDGERREMARFLIIGAGPAGLAAAHVLGEEALVLEAETEFGGLCRSFSVGEQIFDYGGHAFFTKDMDVLALIEEIAPQPLYRQPRAAWVWSHGRMMPYPYQANLAHLPLPVIEDCLVGLCELGDDVPTGANLDDWLRTSFGRGIYDHFLKPYNDKVWAFPVDRIVPLWVGERIVKPDRRAIVRGALSERPFDDFPNAIVAYPGRGGFVEFFRPLYERVRDRVLLDAPVSEIDLAARTVRLHDGRTIDYERLISTMPLPYLVAATRDLPMDVREAAGALEHNSLILVSMTVDGAHDEGRHRIYSADPAVPFHKLVINSNSSDDLRMRSHVGIQAEISTSRWKTVDMADVVDRTVAAIREMGILTESSRIVATDVRRVEFGYPIYERGSIDAAHKICDFFEQAGVLSIGRFGEWAYINSDGALRRGIVAAEGLLNGEPRIARLHRDPA